MKTRFVLALTLTMLLVAVIPASATEPEVYTERFDYSMTTWNSCADEWMEVSGTVHYVSTWVDNGDHVAFQQHEISQLTGMSASGTRYQLVSNANASASLSDTAAYVGSYLYQWRLVGPGPSNNDVFYIRAHNTWNADGTLSTEREEIGWDCR